MNQLPTEPTVTVPDAQANPVAWAIHHLETSPHIYAEFRRLALERLDNSRVERLSADMICHVIRWNSLLRANGDVFKIPDRCTALFARLFVHEYPQHRPAFALRSSAFDLDLIPEPSRGRLLAALEATREARDVR